MILKNLLSRIDPAARKLHNRSSFALENEFAAKRGDRTMTQQATTTEELAFTQPFGAQEKQDQSWTITFPKSKTISILIIN